jgi:hypothetical protein
MSTSVQKEAKEANEAKEAKEAKEAGLARQRLPTRYGFGKVGMTVDC